MLTVNAPSIIMNDDSKEMRTVVFFPVLCILNRYLRIMNTLLNDGELEERIGNDWESFMDSVDEAKGRPSVEYNEPDDGDGEWAWSDEDAYHYRRRGVRGFEDVDADTDSFDELEWWILHRHVRATAESIPGDADYNERELASVIGRDYVTETLRHLKATV